ncbi:hypothetical protein LTR66_014533, partial [Elasticomyces elasticus]
MAEILYPLADAMLKKATSLPEHQVLDDGTTDSRTRTREATPDATMTEYNLQPTSIYRMARDSIATQEKHASEHSRARLGRPHPARLSSANSPSIKTPPSTSQSLNTYTTHRTSCVSFQPLSSAFGPTLTSNTAFLQANPLQLDPSPP